MENKGKFGGAQPKAGRKPTGPKQTSRTVKFDNDLYGKLVQEKNLARFVNTAVRERYDRLESMIKEADEAD